MIKELLGLDRIVDGLKAAKELDCLLNDLHCKVDSTVQSVKSNGVVLEELKQNKFKNLKEK